MTDAVIYDFLTDSGYFILRGVARGFAVAAVLAGAGWAVGCRVQKARNPPPTRPWWRGGPVGMIFLIANFCGFIAAMSGVGVLALTAEARPLTTGTCAVARGAVDGLVVETKFVGRTRQRVHTFTVDGVPLVLQSPREDLLHDGQRVRVDHHDGKVLRVVALVDESGPPQDAEPNPRR